MKNNNILHNILLENFLEFKRICSIHNLRYFAIGGTCIGAIRHSGFIPWDDDMDIVMPIDDWEKFKKIAKHELRSPYEIIDENSHNEYFHQFIKLQNKNTTFIETENLRYINRYSGISIDIMPIIAVSKKNILAKIFKLKINIYNKLNMNSKLRIKDKKRLFSKIVFITLKIPISLFPKHFFLHQIHRLYHVYKINKNTDILFPWRIPTKGTYSNTFSFKDFSDFKEVPFENTTIRIPIGWNNYLKKDFGDFMRIPPKNKRKVHNPAILDFNKSYEKYKNEKN